MFDMEAVISFIIVDNQLVNCTIWLFEKMYLGHFELSAGDVLNLKVLVVEYERKAGCGFLRLG